MTSTTTPGGGGGASKFHTYENAAYDAGQQLASANYIIPNQSASPPLLMTAGSNGNCGSGNGLISAAISSANSGASSFAPAAGGGGTIAVNKTALELSFGEPIIHSDLAPTLAPNPTSGPVHTAKILSTATDSTGITRMLTSATQSSTSASSSSSSGACHRAPASQNLVTKLITFPAQSPMDSLKEWSVSTFKCTKQLINEKRGICPVTNDSQLQNDIELLRENRNKLLQMLRFGQQMAGHYGQLVHTHRQLHTLMNEMSIKCFNTNNLAQQQLNGNASYAAKASSKQVVANFSSLGNNLSSSTTLTSPTRRRHPPPHPTVTSNNSTTAELHSFEDFLPVLNHMKSAANLNLADDFKKNAMTLSAAVKNGEKLLAALNFFCANLSTLINKTIEDTLATVKQYESARLEYDAEKNSLNFISPTAQSSMTYSSEKLELARMRYEQLKEDVQIKMQLLEENTTKVMHKQLLIFNGAFASYTSGNTAALDATLKQFSIRDGPG